MNNIQLVQHFQARVGQAMDLDGVYWAQCVDVYLEALRVVGKPRIYGNAIDLLANSRAAGIQVIYDAPGLLPVPGDFIVYRSRFHKYGHIAILEKATDGKTLTTLDQNVNTGGGGGPLGRHVRNWYDNELSVVGWIRLCPTASGNAPTPAHAPTASGFLKNERGTFKVGVDLLNVRDKPSRSGAKVATYKNGMTLKYDSVYIGDGFIWVSYIGGSGARRYVAVGEEKGGKNVKPYGTFF